MSTSAKTCRDVPFVLFGAGGVGSALLEAIVDARALHEERYGIRLSAVAVCDSSGSVSLPSGLTDAAIGKVLTHKSGGGKLSAMDGASAGGAAVASVPSGTEASEFLKDVAVTCGAQSPGCIIVDCSATDATLPALLLAADSSQGDLRAVSANKKPFADSPMASFDKLVLAKRGPARVRYEATVVAGVPVIAAVQRVVASADPVSKIAGSFSGTLGYVMSGLQAGGKFSEVVLKAKELGYTEPDPRDDLGGVDVARKALILARTLGMKMEMADVSVEPLFPAEMAGLSVPDFLAALPKLDAAFAKKVADAAADGKVLRYAASVNPPAKSGGGGGSLTVGLLAVPADSPLGTLSGSDNLVEVYSKWYAQTPLVLRGAGAGTGTTAAGVLADMVDLAFTREVA